MKKLISLFLIIALMFISCACGISFDERGINFESDKEDDIKRKVEDVFDIDDVEDDIEDEIEDAMEEKNEFASKSETIPNKEMDKANEPNDQPNLLDTMNGAQKREVNVFLSNFSEAFYGAYDYNIIEDKISFAYIHNGINNKSFKPVYKEFDGRSMEGISAELVDSTLIRFFGETVAHETPAGSKWWEYRDGYFWSPAASGETYHRFSVAKNMFKNSDGTYTVEFISYSDDEDPHGPQDQEWYTETVESAQNNSDYRFLYEGTAILREKVYNGENTYELVSYSIQI